MIIYLAKSREKDNKKSVICPIIARKNKYCEERETVNQSVKAIKLRLSMDTDTGNLYLNLQIQV